MLRLSEKDASMINGLWGRKIGMTQVFSADHNVVPVTVIETAHWVVTQIKVQARDGYDAVQFGFVRPRYQNDPFSTEWLKSPKNYFANVREARVLDATATYQVGQTVNPELVLAQGDVVDVQGVSMGRGFQGVVKRHRHKGGRDSHGDKLGRSPGSLEGMRTSGRVRKGRCLPGHMGVENQTVKNISIVSVDPATHTVLVKGSVPGKANAVVFIRKSK